MVLKTHYSYDISKMINHLLIDVIVSVILNYHNKHQVNHIHTKYNGLCSSK